MVKHGDSQRKLKKAADQAEREGNHAEARRIRGIIEYRANRDAQRMKDIEKNNWNPNNYNPNGPN